MFRCPVLGSYSITIVIVSLVIIINSIIIIITKCSRSRITRRSKRCWRRIVIVFVIVAAIIIIIVIVIVVVVVVVVIIIIIINNSDSRSISWRFDFGAKCTVWKLEKRERRYWNFDSRPCLVRINTKIYLPTEVTGVYSVCYMLIIDIFIILYQLKKYVLFNPQFPLFNQFVKYELSILHSFKYKWALYLCYSMSILFCKKSA